ncbi:MAG: hypothetical protein ACKOVA_09895, partial [Novosphingobium sp.]
RAERQMTVRNGVVSGTSVFEAKCRIAAISADSISHMNIARSTAAKSFCMDWSKHHYGRQPLGWALRCYDALPWVRLHALPASKRYAETTEETFETLVRGNRLATEVLGEGSECWVICGRTDDVEGPGELAFEWVEDRLDPESATWRYYVRKEQWRAGGFDDDLRAVAEDAPYYLVWFNAKTGGVFAPYDGGFDLFPSSFEEVTAHKQRYAEWLSDRDDGL